MGLEWWNGGRVNSRFILRTSLLLSDSAAVICSPRRAFIAAAPHGWSVSADISPSLPPSFYRPLWSAAGSFSVFAAAGYRAIKVSQQLSTGWASDLEVETKGLFRPSGNRDNSMHFRNHMHSGSQADVGEGKHLVGNRGMYGRGFCEHSGLHPADQADNVGFAE